MTYYSPTMRTTLLLLFSFGLVACSRHADQWILQSYDKENGYVFTKNGVLYQTTCMATGRPVLGPDNHPDPSPDAAPPDLAHDEEDCAGILAYLHKPVPNLRLLSDTTVLVFTASDQNNFKLEFEIKQAK
jgi:hypothetical protein